MGVVLYLVQTEAEESEMTLKVKQPQFFHLQKRDKNYTFYWTLLTYIISDVHYNDEYMYILKMITTICLVDSYHPGIQRNALEGERRILLQRERETTSIYCRTDL